MTNVALIGNVPSIISNLFNFVLKEEIRVDNIKSKSKDFIKNEVKDKEAKISYVSELEDFSFYNISIYKRNDIEVNDLYDLMIILSSFKGEVLSNLTNTNINYKKMGKLERQVSPPLHAYDFVGNNKTDIKYSNKSYGLLFE